MPGKNEFSKQYRDRNTERRNRFDRPETYPAHTTYYSRSTASKRVAPMLAETAEQLGLIHSAGRGLNRLPMKQPVISDETSGTLPQTRKTTKTSHKVNLWTQVCRTCLLPQYMRLNTSWRREITNATEEQQITETQERMRSVWHKSVFLQALYELQLMLSIAGSA